MSLVRPEHDAEHWERIGPRWRERLAQRVAAEMVSVAHLAAIDLGVLPGPVPSPAAVVYRERQTWPR